MKLLIAEDEDMIRISMEQYIRLHTDRFSHIYLARNGKEATDMILQYCPEIMLLDINMPVKDGIEVMREVKSVGVLPMTVILSGYESFNYAQQAMNLGARGYMTKPSRTGEILKKLSEMADELEKQKGQKPEYERAGLGGTVNRAREYMNENYMKDLTLQKVAEAAGVSANYLSTLFTQERGESFVECLNQIRIEHACIYLNQNYYKIYEIAYKVGFKDEKYFSRVFKKVTGVSPSEYKRADKM
ncbi:MAG: helix-turn-helix domain-containing protein [Ruminococcus sp.]|nr:helix-turn-helix domain-containing protein [Ruminococcus sp.]